MSAFCSSVNSCFAIRSVVSNPASSIQVFFYKIAFCFFFISSKDFTKNLTILYIVSIWGLRGTFCSVKNVF